MNKENIDTRYAQNSSFTGLSRSNMMSGGTCPSIEPPIDKVKATPFEPVMERLRYLDKASSELSTITTQNIGKLLGYLPVSPTTHESCSEESILHTMVHLLGRIEDNLRQIGQEVERL